MKRHTAEEVITKLRQAEADLAQGLSLAQVCQKLASVSRPCTAGATREPVGSRCQEPNRAAGAARLARALAVPAPEARRTGDPAPEFP